MGSFLQIRWGSAVLIVALTLFIQGSLALDCHSCVDLGDGSCSQPKLKKMKCPLTSQVCVEMAATVKWSHGNFSVGEKGCGMGNSGTNDIALDLYGIVAFYKLHQCNTSRCNTKVNLKALALQPIDEENNRVPNGIECYGCFGDDCTNSTIVKCYNSSVGCFHGNFTIKAGNFSLTKPIKGCVADDQCTRVTKGSQPVTLTGSCCSGNLCNADLSNKTFFAHNIPPLKILPDEDTNDTVATNTPGYDHPSLTTIQPSLTPSSTTRKSSRKVTVTPMTPAHHNRDDDSHDHDSHDNINSHDHDDSHDNYHEHFHDHDDYHDHSHDHNNTEITSIRDGNPITAVKVEERHQQPAQVPYDSMATTASLGCSVFMAFLLSWVLL